MDTKNYNFVEFKPFTRVLNASEVTLSSKRLYFNEECILEYLKEKPNKIGVKVLLDVDNKIVAIKFYKEKDTQNINNIIKITKLKRGYVLNCISILNVLKITKPKKPIKLQAVKSDDGFMLLYFDNVL